MPSPKKQADEPYQPPHLDRKRRGRPKVAPDSEQRTRIVDAATRLFLNGGYGKTAMSEIAAAAHVSLTTIYRLFPGKPDLFAAVVQNHRHSMLALPGDYTDVPLNEALAQIFLINMDAEAGRQRDALMTMFIVETRQFPELAPILMKHGPDHSRSLLVEWLDRQHELGRVHVPDTMLAAAMIMDVVYGAASLKTAQTAQWPGGSDRRAYLQQCFTILANGLMPRGILPPLNPKG